MPAKLRAAALLWPTVLTCLALPILLALGTWQMQRKAWKEDLIARVESGARAAPMPLGEILAALERGDDEFKRVRISGRFLHDREFHVWAPAAAGPQWSVVTPLALDTPLGADRRFPTQMILVIRGIVDEAHKDPATRAASQISGAVEVVGRTRFGSSGVFGAKADTVKNQWFAYELDAMRELLIARALDGAGSGTVEKARSLVAPAFVEAEAALGPPPAPQPRLTALNLSNRHLSYALTWYGLALTLIGVYLAYVRTKL